MPASTMLKKFAILAVVLHGALAFELFGFNFGHSIEKLSGVQRMRRELGDGKPCTWQSFEKAFKCCDFPPIVPDGTLKQCVSIAMKKRRKPGTKRIPGMSFACTVDCALRKNDMILESGHANVAKLEEKFLEKANADWDPVVRDTVAKCEEELRSVNITEEGECKLANLHLMYCLFREASLKCPKSSVPEEAEGCDSKMDTIGKCDPWSVMKAVEDKVDAVKAASPLKGENAFAKFASRIKNMTGPAVGKADEMKDSAVEKVEKAVQKVKVGGQNLRRKAGKFFKKARQSFATNGEN